MTQLCEGCPPAGKVCGRLTSKSFEKITPRHRVFFSDGSHGTEVFEVVDADSFTEYIDNCQGPQEVKKPRHFPLSILFGPKTVKACGAVVAQEEALSSATAPSFQMMDSDAWQAFAETVTDTPIEE